MNALSTVQNEMTSHPVHCVVTLYEKAGFIAMKSVQHDGMWLAQAPLSFMYPPL